MKFDKWSEHARAFVDEIATTMGPESTETQAAQALRLTLHVLRDQLGPGASMKLISQLPMFIKAIYVDGWKPESEPVEKIRRMDDFADAMFAEDESIARREFYDHTGAERAARAVFHVIKRHVSPGESEDVIATLPKDLKRVWREA